MTTAYVMTMVGNKLFTIEWDLTADGIAEVEGDKFECRDCEIVSIFGIAPSSADTRIAISNSSEPESYRTSVLVEDTFYSPPSGTLTGPALPLSARWIWPMLDVGSGNLKLSILFREV